MAFELLTYGADQDTLLRPRRKKGRRRPWPMTASARTRSAKIEHHSQGSGDSVLIFGWDICDYRPSEPKDGSNLYDSAGRTVAIINALGNRYTSVADAANRVIALRSINWESDDSYLRRVEVGPLGFEFVWVELPPTPAS